MDTTKINKILGNIYLQFKALLHIVMTQVTKILPLAGIST